MKKCASRRRRIPDTDAHQLAWSFIRPAGRRRRRCYLCLTNLRPSHLFTYNPVNSWPTVAFQKTARLYLWLGSHGCSFPSTFHGLRATISYASSPRHVRDLLRMNEVELRVPLGLGETLQDIVYRQGSHEYIAFGLVSHAILGGRDTLLLRRVLPLPESEYRKDTRHGATWGGVAMIPVIEDAMSEGLGIVIFHAHPHAGPPTLSNDDCRKCGSVTSNVSATRADKTSRVNCSVSNACERHYSDAW